MYGKSVPKTDAAEQVEAITSLHRILVCPGKLDLNDDEFESLMNFRPHPPQATHLLFQTMWPAWLDLSLDQKVEFLTLYHEWSWSIRKPSDFDALLGLPLLDSVGQLSRDCRSRLITSMAGTYAISCICGDGTAAQEWRELLSEANSRGVDFHCSCCLISSTTVARPPRHSFLDLFLSQYANKHDMWENVEVGRLNRPFVDIGMKRSEKVQNLHATLQRGMKRLLDDLLDAGVDLLDFGSSQRCMPDLSICNMGWITVFGAPACMMRIIGFTYGSSSSDWHIWVSNPLDEWAGEFWEMIEHPERAIPVSWHDWYDDSDDESNGLYDE